MLNEKETDHFRQILNDMRNRLIAESEHTVHGMQEEASTFADPSDRAALESDRITTLRIRDRERKLIFKVEDAMKRLDNGTFGLCEICNEFIGVKRLEIRPVTTLCIACKEQQEAEER